MAVVLGKLEPYSYEFANYRLVPSERLLLRDGQPVSLPPKIFETLLALVESGNHLVGKDDLMARLWPDTFVEEATLSRNISDLRKALGESGHEHKLIETVPKCGYRFVAAVRRLPRAAATVETDNQARELASEEGRPGAERLQLIDSRLDVAIKVDRPSWVTRKALVVMLILATSFAALIAARAWRAPSWWVKSRGAGAVSSVRSIAVLPFKSLGAQERDEALELGVADALITRLSNVKQIDVRPSSAVFKYAGQTTDPVQAGRELRVDAVLDGSIQRQGDRARISVQLVNVAGVALWADQFDAKVTDFFTTQDSLSEQIMRSLTLHLTGREEHTPAKRDTSNAEAYQLFLKARYWWSKNTPEGFQKAIDYCNQAIALDKNYSLAYAGLADGYSLQVSLGLIPPGEGLLKARAAAEKAVQLDDSSASAHISLGHLRWLTWDWAGAEREFQRVVELDPPYPAAHLWYATYLSSLGRHPEALAIIKKAQERNPISIAINECAEQVHFYARQHDESIAMGLKNLELEPERATSAYFLALAYEQKGMYDEAVAAQLKTLSLRGAKSEEIEALRAAYGASGWRGYWLKEIERAQAAARHRYFSPFDLAQMYVRAGHKERAFELLDKAYAERSSELTLLKVHPVFDPLRSDPRYADLRRRVGFPD